jgi:hypothetical protein
MTRSTGEEWGLLVTWPSKHDAHGWLRNAEHRPRQSRGRIKYGYNRVQEIVSGTTTISARTQSIENNDSESTSRSMNRCTGITLLTETGF